MTEYLSLIVFIVGVISLLILYYRRDIINEAKTRLEVEKNKLSQENERQKNIKGQIEKERAMLAQEKQEWGRKFKEEHRKLDEKKKRYKIFE